MSQPNRYLLIISAFLFVVALAALLAGDILASAFLQNIIANSLILMITAVGIVITYASLFGLRREVLWVEALQNPAGEELPVGPQAARRLSLMAPLASMLGNAQDEPVYLTSTTVRVLLDGVQSRVDERRELSRYLVSALVFVGLLGTFAGLIITINGVKDAIQAIDINASFASFILQLDEPLRGMGTAFSSSLFGLGCSLGLGFIELQASRAQNRFVDELEDWLSAMARIGGDGSVQADKEPSATVRSSGFDADTLASFAQHQRLLARAEADRIVLNNNLVSLVEVLDGIKTRFTGEQELLTRLVEQQEITQSALQHLAALAQSQAEQSDMHPLATQLEALGVQLAELSESLDARQESRHDLLQQALSNITHSLHRIQARAREESE